MPEVSHLAPAWRDRTAGTIRVTGGRGLPARLSSAPVVPEVHAMTAWFPSSRRIVAVATVGAAVLGVPVLAGLFGDSVDLEDLARLSDAGIEALRPTEHAAFLAHIRLATAQEDEGAAKGSLKTAERVLDVEQLDLKAARAEFKAAEAEAAAQMAGAESSRLGIARTLVRAGQSDLRIAEALVAWRSAELAASRSSVALAKARLDAAEAERDLARAVRLVEESLPAAAKYDRGKLEERARRRGQDADKAAKKLGKRRAEADDARRAYEAIAPARPESA